MKIDIDRLHKAHYSSGRGIGKTIYALDSLIRVFQLQHKKCLLYITNTQKEAHLASDTFQDLLISQEIEFQRPFENTFLLFPGKIRVQFIGEQRKQHILRGVKEEDVYVSLDYFYE